MSRLSVLIAILLTVSVAHANPIARRAQLKALAVEISQLSEARDAIALNKPLSLSSGSGPYRVADVHSSDLEKIEALQLKIEEKYKQALVIAEYQEPSLALEYPTHFGLASARIAEISRIAMLLSIIYVAVDSDRFFAYLRESPNLFHFMFVPMAAMTLHAFYLKGMQFGNKATFYDRAWADLKHTWLKLKQRPPEDLKRYFFAELQKTYAPLKLLELAAADTTERCRVLLTQGPIENEDLLEEDRILLKKTRTTIQF